MPVVSMVTAPAPDEAGGQAEATRLNQRALEFMIGAQKIVFEEMAFAGQEMLQRTQTEVQLFSEFAAKMAEAHSVRNIGTLWQECAQHQLDFIRRDSERLFRHGERMIAATANLIGGRTQE